MGNFALTNPGLVYDEGPTIDSVTGQVVQSPPIIKYFKNPNLRAQQFATDSSRAIAKAPLAIAPSTVTGASGDPNAVDANGAPLMPTLSFSSDGGPRLGTPVLPKPFQPTFTQTTTDANGMQIPINPAQTKLGKLVSILGAAARGALAGWGTGNPGAGAAQARNIPFEEAQQRNQLAQQSAQTALLRSQSEMVQTPYGPMPAGMAKLIFPALVRAGATTGAAQIAAQSRENVANIEKRFIPVPGVGLFDASRQGVLPNTTNGVTVTEEIRKDYNLPPEAVGKTLPLTAFSSLQRAAAQYAPTVSSESETTDLMGNTKTSRTTQKLPPGSSAGAPVIPYPGASPTGANATAGSSPRAAGAVQQTPGAPVPVNGASRASGSAAAPSPKAAQQSTSALPDVYALSPDVEARLQALVPKNAQGIMRAILQYRAQLPRNVGKSAPQYAQTVNLATQVDPTFNEQNYDLIRKVKADYGPGGSVGKQALAFNTALNHMGLLADAATQLQNGKLQIANKLANQLKIQFGSDAVTNFNTIKTYLATELAKGFGGGVATDASRAEAEPILSQIQSPAQLAGGFKTAADLLRGKISAQEAAYSQAPPLGTGQKVGLISDEGHGVLQKLGLEAPQMLTFADSNGVSHQILASDWKKNQAGILRRDPGAKLIQ